MAQVPTSTVPTVAPSTAPLPTQNLQPPSEAFGASAAGQDLSELGAATGQTADALHAHAMAYQALNNKAAADAASLDADSAVAQIGEKWREDNPGLAASDPKNMAALASQVEQARAQFGTGLSPMAAAEFDSASRRNAAGVIQTTASWAAGQRHEAITKTNSAMVENAAAKMAANTDDPEAQAAGAATIRSTAVSLATLNGWDKDTTDAYLRSTLGAVYAGQIGVAYSTGNIAKAEALFDQHKGDMTQPQIDQVMRGLKVGGQEFTAKSIADQVFNGLAPTAPAALSGTYLAQVNKDEGTGQNPRSTASGTGQFIQKTWLETMKTDPQFADVIAGKSDADILALRSNPAVANRAIASYANANTAQLVKAGFSATSANVALAHHFGAQGAMDVLNAPSSAPTSAVFSPEAMAANPDLKGKTAGQIVAGFQQRYSNNPIDTSSGGASVQLPVPPPIHDTDDPKMVQAEYDKYGRQVADAMFPTNAVMADKTYAAIQARMQEKVRYLDATQGAAADRLGAAIEQDGITDTAQLATAYPQATDDLALIQATPRLNKALNSQINYNAARSPERLTAVAELEGMKKMSAVDPGPFLKADIRAIPNLTQSDRMTYMKAQADVQNAVRKGAQSDNVTATALTRSLAGQEMLKNLHLTGKETAADPAKQKQFYQLAGSVSEKVEEYAAAHGKPPVSGSPEMNAILAAATATHTTPTTFDWKTGNLTFGSQSTPAFQVPDEERQAIVDSYAKRGRQPSEHDIAYTYQKRLSKPHAP